MRVTRAQKRYIVKNLPTKNPQEIADELSISKESVLKYMAKMKEKGYASVQNVQGPQNQKGTRVSLFLEKSTIVPIVFIIIAVLIVYINSINNVFLSDDFGILQNPNLGTFQDIVSQPLNFLRPLFFAIAFHAGGLNPAPFRMINILMHIGVSILLFLILAKLYNKTAAFVSALLVSVHPIFVESVTWISGGGYAQYSFFFLLSLYFYILSTGKKLYYAFSVVAYVLALVSSITAVSLPLMFLIYELSFGSLKKSWLKIVPFLIISGVFTIHILTGGIQQRQESLSNNFYNTGQGDSIFVKIPVAMSNYFQLIFWPQNLTLYHSELGTTFGMLFFQWIFVLLLGIAIIILFLKKKTAFFWLSLFIISLLPSIFAPGLAWIVAERYVYLGAIGIITIIGLIIHWGISQNKYKTFATVGLIIIVVLLSFRTIFRNIDWKNEDNLWIATGKTSPSDPKTHNNLGDVYARQGNLQKAAEEFSTAIKLNPNYADAYHNLGNIYRQAGNNEGAIKAYLQASSLNPRLWQSHQNSASIYFQYQEYEKAIESMKKALAVYPENPALHVNLGIIYLKSGKKEDAARAFNNALKIDPQNQTALQGLREVHAEE